MATTTSGARLAAAPGRRSPDNAGRDSPPIDRHSYAERREDTTTLSNNRLHQLHLGHNKSTAPDAVPAFILIPGKHESVLVAWELTSFVMLMYTALVVPFSLSFQNHDRWDASQATTYIETLVDIFFIVDVVRNFRTAFYDRGKLVTDGRKIARHYAKTWLIIDVVASFPLDWFAGLFWDSTGDQSGLLLLLRLCKLWKLLRLLRLWRVGVRSKAETGTLVGRIVHDLLIATSSTGFWFAMHGCIVFLVLHVDGCIQFFFATLDAFPSEMANWTFSDVAESSWVVRAGLADQPVTTQYSAALVHALLQMLGSAGLVPPQRLAEYWLYLVSLMTGAGICFYLVASLTSRFVHALSGSHGEYRTKLENIEKWMEFEEFPTRLRQRLRIYFELKYPGGSCFDSNAICQELSLPLQQKVSLHICREVIKTTFQISETTFLEPNSPAFELASSLAMALERRVFQRGDALIRQGSVPPGMYFLTSGEVEILVTDASNVVQTIPFKGEKIVGEKSLLNPQARAEASVRVSSFDVEAHLLSRSDYTHLVDKFPFLRAWMKQVASVRMLADYTDALQNYDKLEPPEKIKLVKIDALRKALDGSPMTSYTIVEEFWQQRDSIQDLLQAEAFKEVPFTELSQEKYGVLTYTWSGMPWKDILLNLEDTTANLFWIDIFCLDQTLPADEKMRTIKQTMTIYRDACEHHILGHHTFRRGWCVCELSARKKESGTVEQMLKEIHIHTEFATPTVQAEEAAAIKDLETIPCMFAQTEFSKETDRAVVKRMIEELWGKGSKDGVLKFERFLQELMRGLGTPALRRSVSLIARGAVGVLLRQPGRRSSSVAAMNDPRSAFPHLKVNAKVEHPERGKGRIVEIKDDLNADAKKVVVEYEAPDRYGKKVHEYLPHSLHKLTVVQTRWAAVDRRSIARQTSLPGS